MSALLQLQRRTQLYGPGRTKERETARQLQLADHVKANLQKCAGGIPRSQTFKTTTSLSLKQGASSRGQRDDSMVETQRKYQSASHIHLGNKIPPSNSLTKTDFRSKPVPQYKRHVADRTINLPDMAPRYMVNRRLGATHYSSSYDAEQASKSVERVGINCSKEKKQFNKATHFELGDHFDSPESTSALTYRGRPAEDSLSSSTQSEQGKTKSSVFREGDYNVVSVDAEETFTSTQRKDFKVQQKPKLGTVSLPKSYSHVLPRCTVDDPVSRLREILIERNKDAFTNPRDPTSINVVRAFATYDKMKCGSIGIDDIRAMTKIFGIALSSGDIDGMLKECGCKGGEKMDFYTFCEYLTSHTEPFMNPEEFISNSMDSYRARQHTKMETNRKEYQIGADFQTSTHFHLGSDGPSSRSVYGKDFDSARMQGSMKANREPKPRSSKVMHEYPRITKGTSTSRADYVRHDEISRADRSQDCQEFKDKQEKPAFEITAASGNQKEQNMSVAMLSYRKPEHLRSLTADPTVRKDYHHLESNRALPHPLSTLKVSEVKDNYVVPRYKPKDYSEQRGRNIGERTSRDLQNKRTHFVLGSTLDPMTSETGAQFRDKKVKKYTIPPAGITSLPTQGYPIMEHSSEEGSYTTGTLPGNFQQSLQCRNYIKHINPRDTLNMNLRKAFLEYDTDLSGVITKDQLKAVCRTMKVEAKEEDVDQVIAICNKKGDGLIDYNEFAKNLTKVRPASSRVFKTSVTGRDFIHPQSQQLSESRRLALAKDSQRFKKPFIQSTHYFHLDHSEGMLISVTGRDFIPPEQAL